MQKGSFTCIWSRHNECIFCNKSIEEKAVEYPLQLEGVFDQEVKVANLKLIQLHSDFQAFQVYIFAILVHSNFLLRYFFSCKYFKEIQLDVYRIAGHAQELYTNHRLDRSCFSWPLNVAVLVRIALQSA